MKQVTVGPELGPVDFAMKPGGTIRVRVLDHRGKPAPRARISLGEWRGSREGFAFAQVNQTADEFGVWEWNEAPLDEIKASIRPVGRSGMQLFDQSLIAGDQEQVFRLPAVLVVSGRVIDAATKEPSREFRVVPGIRSREKDNHVDWMRRETFTATAGQY